ncbi:MAG: long-chain fatty acid--CoA ligase [Armatimonadota bacterium]|nr:MAG: long-chain fatty acid--CoA ligase [Armatimonadota bacterium]
MTLGKMLDESARRFRHRACLIFRGKRTTYGEFADLTDRYARAMYDIGIRKGDRVAIWALNGPEFVTAYYGNAKLGAISVPINTTFTPEEAHYILSDAGAKAIVAHAAYEPALHQIWQRLPDLQHGIVIPAEDAPSSFLRWDDLMQQGADALARADESALDFKERGMTRDVAVFLYTSGTTGHPKGAMLTHRNIIWDAEACHRAIPLDRDDVALCVLPMFHSFAELVLMVFPVTIGASVAILERFIPANVLQAIHEHEVTLFCGVPSMFAVMLQVPREQRPPITTLKYCVSGGAPLPAKVFQGFKAEFGVPILEGDGPTECSPVVSVNPLEGPHKIGSVGLPLPGIQVKIFDEHDREVRTGEIGEIVVKAPSVMLGYHNQREATQEALRGGWMHTGDMGRIDEDGYIYIVDRKKDMLICSGMNVYPREVEEVLYQHPAVAEAAVVGMVDELRGEVPVAFIALAEGKSATEREIISFCRERLARFKVPRKIEFRDQLPKTATGKILKQDLRNEQ